MEIVFSYLLRRLRRWWYRLRRYKWKVKRMWDRFKWCLIGGFAYAAGRTLFYVLRDYIK